MVKDGIFLSERYEVLSKLGAGGMADVYKGRDLMLNRYVAIKVLKKEYREDESFVKKFRSEAQAAAGLMHPNIVNVYDVGEDRGLYYMVMELVEGITLKEYIQKKGRLSAREVVSIAIQMCTGIEAAHDHNIIHRDIKPQNIIISKEGKVKVTDFGIARAATSHTVSSNAMGSVHYVSPEQARGGFCDAKSDIYSAGITMYEMITGQVPFDGESTVSIAMKHLQEIIKPPSTIVPDIPKALEDIILKCTQKSPERRYPNAGALIRDLKRTLVEPDGDFVEMIPLRTVGDTVIISPEDMGRIKNQYSGRTIEDTNYDRGDDYDDDDYDYDDDDYDDDDYGYDDDYDDDDYDDVNKIKTKRKNDKTSNVNPGMNKMMKILSIVAVVVIAFVLIFLGGKAIGIFKFGPGSAVENEIDKDNDKDKKTIEVPNLVGEKKEVAEEICKKKNLVLKVVEQKNSDDIPAGQIMEQKTKAGKKVAAKSVIEVIVSTGKAEIEVLDVTDMDQDDAWDALKTQGFENYKIEVEYSDSVTNGHVIRTSPEAGEKASKETEIILYISKGAQKQEVPSLVGKTASEAAAILNEKGFMDGGSTEEYSDSVAAGKIIRQSVKAGKLVDPSKTTVSYVVSKGKKLFKVPSIEIGGSPEKAEAELRKAGFTNVERGEYEPSNLPYGTVVGVEPGVGSEIDSDTMITIRLSAGPNHSDDE